MELSLRFQNEVMRNDNEIFKRIVRLIENSIGSYRQPLTRETRLDQDLAITDEEALELITEFGLKFNVNLTDFDIKKYFPETHNNIFLALYEHIARSKPQYQHVLTIGDLENAAKNGRLN